jgi:homoserine acetyltransferase
MRLNTLCHHVMLGVAMLLAPLGAQAADPPQPQAGELFGPGQPLDAAKYFIIIPDAIGSGRSSRPSDGMRAQFPKYNYEDMVTEQYRLVTEHLGLHHLKLVIGQSMGGMHAWMWREMYPDFMSVLIPMGSQPTAMSAKIIASSTNPNLGALNKSSLGIRFARNSSF